MERSWILVFLYILLIFVYAWYIPNNRIPSWRPIPTHEDTTTTTTSYTPCSSLEECPPHHVCLLGECIPLLLRGDTCNELTGTWSVTDVRGKTFAICTCTFPHLVTQKHFGGNCDVDVACGTHGFYNTVHHECECDDGYRAVREPHPTCKKLTAVERINLYPCEDDEVNVGDVRPSDGFARTFLSLHTDKKCFKRPCTFDALTGRPLKHGRYEPGVGCVCDPTMGLFGVRLDAFGEYVDGKGYNACASILSRDPDEPLEVDLYAYFYLLNRLPVAFIEFRNVPTRYVLSVFAKKETIRVSQEWPFDYMQYAFRNALPYTTRTRSARMNVWSYTMSYKEWESRSNEMIECRDLSLTLHRGQDPHSNVYKLLYQYPVCHIEAWDDKVPEPYRGRYVLNPFYLLLKIYPHFARSNGVIFKYRGGAWNLDIAEPYDLDTYVLEQSHVPDIRDAVTDGLEDLERGIDQNFLNQQATIRAHEKSMQQIF